MAGPRDLTTAVLRFGQMLRAAGLPLTVTELMDGVRALEVVDLLDRQDVYLPSGRRWSRAGRSSPPSIAASTCSGASRPRRGRGSKAS